MDLILWRHADTEEGTPDLGRNLTPKGRRQAKRMANWLKPLLPQHTRILVSPANRTRQTADALQMHYEICNLIGPDCSAEHMRQAARWPDGNRAVMLVGHNPAISELASLLLADKRFPLTMRKGAAWWFISRTRAGESSVLLKMAMTAGLLKKI